MKVDRPNRDLLAAAIRRYLSEQSTAFEFDEEIFQIRGNSDDSTLATIASALWFHYDDCTDHKVVLTKCEWDCFHRLLLVLESDAVIRVERWRVWSWSQMAAVLALLAFTACSMWVGMGMHLALLVVPWGMLSMMLARWRRRIVPEKTAAALRLTPFASVAEIRAVRRSIRGFTKQRYPSELAIRRIRSPLMAKLLLLPTYVVWLLFAPAILLFQALPKCDCHISVGLEC
jgi:hypothetical protein